MGDVPEAAVLEKLTREQVEAQAQEYGVDPFLLRAVIAVESSGSGFLLPSGFVKILFERHILWKRLEGRKIDPTLLARVRPDLCGRHWERKYYRGGAAEWDRVAGVLAWASRNAPGMFESYKKSVYESCSWGLLQVMGFNYAAAGFKDVYQLKHAAEAGEAAQLAMALRFMAYTGSIKRLVEKDLPGFVRQYNGPGQVPLYTARLKYEWWRLRKAG